MNKSTLSPPSDLKATSHLVPVLRDQAFQAKINSLRKKTKDKSKIRDNKKNAAFKPAISVQL
jgi:hypothetical protein